MVKSLASNVIVLTIGCLNSRRLAARTTRTAPFLAKFTRHYPAVNRALRYPHSEPTVSDCQSGISCNHRVFKRMARASAKTKRRDHHALVRIYRFSWHGLIGANAISGWGRQ